MSRVAIGIWIELAPGSRWANEGVARVVGFLIEGAAQTGRITFRVVVPVGMKAAIQNDLRTLAAKEGEDWTVDEPGEEFATEPLARPDEIWATVTRLLAEYANKHVPVEGWFVPYPFFAGSVYLKGAKAVLFPDAVPYDFPMGWDPDAYWNEDGLWPSWRATAAKVIEQSAAVITFSKHVAHRHVTRLFPEAKAKTRVIPLAPPDLSGLLPFVQDRQRTVASRQQAAELLRAHAGIRGWHYLRDFAFEDVPFVVVSTQDRVTKNIGRVAEMARRLLRRDHIDVKMFATATFHFGADWTLLPGLIESEQLQRDVISMSDLPRDVHAALLHCAACIVHPSFFEGIVGALPFYESVSVGTPCVMARGPHVAELLADEPDLAPDTFDPYDIEGLATLVRSVLQNRRAEMLARQRPIYERLLRQRSWGQVAEEYANAATGGMFGTAWNGGDVV